MNIFPPFQFHPDMYKKYSSFEEALEGLVSNVYLTNHALFKSWLLKHIQSINASPYRMFSLNIPTIYQNEDKLSPDKKQLLKEYKIQYAKVRVKFLQKYIELLKNDAKEDDMIDSLIKYEVAGFKGMMKLSKEEKWLKKSLKTIGEK